MTKLRGWRCFSVVMVMALILGLGTMAVSTVPAQAEEGTWDIQTVDDISVMSTSLVLDSNGYPHISYTTGLAVATSLHYARWTGTAWVKEMVDDAPAIVTSLALDSNGYPHIGYTTFAVGDNSLHYARWTGTAWAKETVDERDVFDCSLALDSEDRPHISYTLADSGYLEYTHWTGTRWVGGTVDDENLTWSTSMVLDSNDRPHISYAAFSLGSLHYAHWTGTAWAKETVDDVNVSSSSIALDSNGYPHISYTTAEGFGSLHYARWMGTAWAKETVDPSDASDCSLALDSNNRPHISYFVSSGGPVDGGFTFTGMLKYANWTDSAWDIQTLDEETYTLKGPAGPPGLPILVVGGKGSSISLDGYDWPHISYGNLVPSISIASLHYAHLIPPATATVDTAAGAGTTTFSTSAGGIANLTAATSTPCGTPPSGLDFPHGFFSFAITDILPGSTVTITITLPSDMFITTQYWKCINGQWVDATSILGSNDGDSVFTLTLTDGGPFDADGQANGTIIDPGGPAVVIGAPAPVSTPIRPPTLKPAQMAVQYLGITPKQTFASQPVTISTNVVNTGDQPGSLNVVLKINGTMEQTKLVSLGPHGTQPIKFTVTRAQPGTYTVDIGGQKGSFTINGAGGTSSSDRMIGIFIIIGALVLIAAVVVWLLIRRPA